MESPIKQGDIFKNIPYFSFDLILRSKPGGSTSLDDEAIEIINEITTNGDEILVETIISATFCILASQNCDIQHEDFLIFYPLVEYDRPIKNIDELLKDITDTTHDIYLPAININSQKIGPFRVKFKEPIKIPKKLFGDKLKSLRVVQIKESARKIFIGKLTNFFARLPIDEVIFLEIDEIDQYLIKKWKENKWNKENMKEIFTQIKWNLKENDREKDLTKIYFDTPVNIKTVEEIRKKIEKLSFIRKFENVTKVCEEIKSIDSLRGQKNKYEELKGILIYNDDSVKKIINSEEFCEKSINKIEEFKKDPNKKRLAEHAEEALEFFNNIEDHI